MRTAIVIIAVLVILIGAAFGISYYMSPEATLGFMSANNWIAEIFAVIAITAILLPFAAWALATFDLVFTTCPSGNMKFVVRGETVLAIIYNEEDLRLSDLDKPWELKPEFKKRKRLFFSLFLVGFPGIDRIHEFPITKDSENPDATDDPSTWITQRGEVVVNSLRLAMQRSFVFRNLELKDRSVVNVLVTTKLRVVDWFIPIFNLKGKFFENTAGLIEPAVGDKLKQLSLQELIEAKLREDEGILSDLKDENGTFAKSLIRQVGLELEGISMSRVDPGDADLRKAMNAAVIATKEGEATIATATAKADARKIEARAEAEAQTLLAGARGTRIRETYANLGNDSEAAANVLSAEAFSSATSSINTIVLSGEKSPTMPPPQTPGNKNLNQPDPGNGGNV